MLSHHTAPRWQTSKLQIIACIDQPRNRKREPTNRRTSYDWLNIIVNNQFLTLKESLDFAKLLLLDITHKFPDRKCKLFLTILKIMPLNIKFEIHLKKASIFEQLEHYWLKRNAKSKILFACYRTTDRRKWERSRLHYFLLHVLQVITEYLKVRFILRR